ncbi:MAG: hypothetical protein PHC61_15290, partial [Chitinivibrionales bacterium]|nr:hypothetical protein [Chitinivibrionales bacterium]
MSNIRKIITQAEMLEQLKQGKVSLPPILFRIKKADLKARSNRYLKTVIEGSWEKSRILFGAEINPLSTPKAFFEGVSLLKNTSLPSDYFPLLVLPFLSEKHLQELEREKISGIDFCGNGVVIVPEKLMILRSGQKNCFPSYAPIKNIYRQNSSMVGRLLMVYPQFPSVKEVVEKIGTRDFFNTCLRKSSLTFGTVSKVLAGMDQDLLIERGNRDIRLLQPDTLLEKLAQNFKGTAKTAITSLKVKLDRSALLKRLSLESKNSGLPIIATG